MVSEIPFEDRPSPQSRPVRRRLRRQKYFPGTRWLWFLWNRPSVCLALHHGYPFRTIHPRHGRYRRPHFTWPVFVRLIPMSEDAFFVAPAFRTLHHSSGRMYGQGLFLYDAHPFGCQIHYIFGGPKITCKLRPWQTAWPNGTIVSRHDLEKFHTQEHQMVISHSPPNFSHSLRSQFHAPNSRLTHSFQSALNRCLKTRVWFFNFVVCDVEMFLNHTKWVVLSKVEWWSLL